MTVDDIIGVYASRGARRYRNEPVSQLEHALQCAALAQAASASAELVAAAFLHDLGHLITEEASDSDERIADLHQYVAIPFLHRIFPATVTEPIRLHVDARRLVSRAEIGYRLCLSPATRRGVDSPGRAFSPLEAEFFLARPHAWDAIQLRRWDDHANVAGKQTPSLNEMRSLLLSLEA